MRIGKMGLWLVFLAFGARADEVPSMLSSEERSGPHLTLTLVGLILHGSARWTAWFSKKTKKNTWDKSLVLENTREFAEKNSKTKKKKSKINIFPIDSREPYAEEVSVLEATQTTVVVLFHHKKFTLRMNQPVDMRGAQPWKDASEEDK